MMASTQIYGIFNQTHIQTPYCILSKGAILIHIPKQKQTTFNIFYHPIWELIVIRRLLLFKLLVQCVIINAQRWNLPNLGGGRLSQVLRSPCRRNHHHFPSRYAASHPGRSSVSHIFNNPSAVRGELSFNCLLQLNVDSTAL